MAAVLSDSSGESRNEDQCMSVPRDICTICTNKFSVCRIFLRCTILLNETLPVVLNRICTVERSKCLDHPRWQYSCKGGFDLTEPRESHEERLEKLLVHGMRYISCKVCCMP